MTRDSRRSLRRLLDRRPRRRRPAFRPSPEGLEDRMLLTFGYQGGPIMSNVNINPVYVGSYWNTDPSGQATMNQLNNFDTVLTKSSYWSMLSEYSTPTQQLGLGTFGTADVVPDGRVASDVGVSPQPGAVLTEANLQVLIGDEINAHELPAPGPNQLYVVDLPPGLFSQRDFDSETFNDFAHHDSFTSPTVAGGTHVIYAVIPDPSIYLNATTFTNPTTGQSRQAQPGVDSFFSGLDPFEMITTMASHEIVESATDPLWSVPNQAAWFDPSFAAAQTGDQEVADLGLQPPGRAQQAIYGPAGFPGDQFTVQALFDKSQGGVFLPPVESATQVEGFSDWAPNAKQELFAFGNDGSAPAFATFNGQLYVAWAQSGTGQLWIERLNPDGSQQFNPNGSPEISSVFGPGPVIQGSPTLISEGNDLVVAFTRASDGQIFNSRLNTPPDGQISLVSIWQGTEQFSDYGPALGFFKNPAEVASDSLPDPMTEDGHTYIAWTGTTDQLNLLRPSDSQEMPASNLTSSAAPAMAVHDGQLFYAFTGKNHELEVSTVIFNGDTAIALSQPKILSGTKGDETSDHSPSLAEIDGSLVIAWTGQDSNQLNIMRLNDDGSADENTKWISPPTETSSDGPKLLANGAELFIAWTGTDNVNTINVAPVGLIESFSESLSAMDDSNGVLTVNGDQFPGATIVVDRNSSGGLALTINGNTENWGSAALTSVVIDTGSGTNTVDVRATPAGVPVTINGNGTNTTVNVGANGVVQRILSDISIQGPYHEVELNVDDSSDPTGRTAGVLAIGGMGLVDVGGVNVTFGATALDTLTLRTGTGVNTVYLEDATASVLETDVIMHGSDVVRTDPLTFGTSESMDTVYVLWTDGVVDISGDGGRVAVCFGTNGSAPLGTVGSLAGITGDVLVTNPTGSLNLYTDDGGDTAARTAVLSGNSLAGLSPGTIYWGTTNPGTPGVSLTIYGGSGQDAYTITNLATATSLYSGNGPDTVDVESSTASLGVDLGTGADTADIATTSRNLQGVLGGVNISGGTGYDKLFIDDGGNSGNNNYTLTASSLTRTYAGAIWYSGMKEIHVDGGSGLEIYHVDGTAPGSVTYLTTNSGPYNAAVPSSSLGSQVDVTGTTGGLSIIGASGPAWVTVGTGNLAAISGNVLATSSGGQVNLDVDDSTDTSQPNAFLGIRQVGTRFIPGWEALTGLGAITIDYLGSVATTIELGSGTLGVLETGSAATTVDANGANVNVFATTGPLAIDATHSGSVAVGAGSLAGIAGPVSVTSSDSTAKLVVAGSGDSGRSGTLAGGIPDSLTGLAPAAIAFAPAQVATTIDLGPAGTLAIGDSVGIDGVNSVQILGVGSDTLRIADGGGATPPSPLPAGFTSFQESLVYTVKAQDIQRVVSYSYTTATSQNFGLSMDNIIYSGISGLEVDGSNATIASKTLAIQGTPAGTAVLIKTGAGATTVAIDAALASLAGPLTVNGQGGTTTLDYSSYTGDVQVDLPIGQATGLASITGIQNVTGSKGNDILVGNGGNVLTGGSGRNLLIAGATPSTLQGGSDSDMLVGGATPYDTSLAALDVILAEWTRTDVSYGTRVSHLLGGGGLNGNVVLNAADVKFNAGGNILDGNAGVDIFYGQLSGDGPKPDTTDWNSALGEIFVDPKGEHASIQINAVGLSVPQLVLDGTQDLSTSAADWVTLTQGAHVLYSPGGYGAVSFSINPDGTVGYASTLQGELTGAGTNQLVLHGDAVTIDATAIAASTPKVWFDSIAETTAAPFSITTLPGTHLIESATGYGSLTFTIDNSGHVGYSANPQTVLGGAGSSRLAVLGANVTIDATAIAASTPKVWFDSIAETTAAPFSITTLPGTHLIESATGYGALTFTIDNSGHVGYTANPQTVLGGAGTSRLAVLGANVTIDATAIAASTPKVWFDNIAETTAAPFSITTLPGTHLIESATGYGAIPFTIDNSGHVGYAANPQTVLAGAGTSRLAVLGANVTIDATAIAASTPKVWFDNIAETTAAPFSITTLPGTHLIESATGYGALTFTIDNSGHVGYAANPQTVLAGAGTSRLAVLGANVTIDATAIAASTPKVWFDNIAETTAAPFSITTLPGAHLIESATGNGALTFTIDNSGHVGYAANPQTVLAGAGSSRLAVLGANVTVDATAIAGSTPKVWFDNVAETTAAPFSITTLPGTHIIESATGYGGIPFTIGQTGKIGYTSSNPQVIPLRRRHDPARSPGRARKL